MPLRPRSNGSEALISDSKSHDNSPCNRHVTTLNTVRNNAFELHASSPRQEQLRFRLEEVRYTYKIVDYADRWSLERHALVCCCMTGMQRAMHVRHVCIWGLPQLPRMLYGI